VTPALYRTASVIQNLDIEKITAIPPYTNPLAEIHRILSSNFPSKPSRHSATLHWSCFDATNTRLCHRVQTGAHYKKQQGTYNILTAGCHLNANATKITIKKVKGKVLPYTLPSVGPGADPSVQAVRPHVTINHPSSGRLPLLSTRPAVTFVSDHQMASPLTEVTDMQLQLTTHHLTLKGIKD